MIDAIDGWVNGARETIAASSDANNLYTVGGKHVSERSGRFKVNGVPCQLNKGVSVGICVSTANVRTPVADGQGSITPEAGISC